MVLDAHEGDVFWTLLPVDLHEEFVTSKPILYRVEVSKVEPIKISYSELSYEE